jgi:hypothetical protein
MTSNGKVPALRASRLIKRASRLIKTVATTPLRAWLLNADRSGLSILLYATKRNSVRVNILGGLVN